MIRSKDAARCDPALPPYMQRSSRNERPDNCVTVEGVSGETIMCYIGLDVHKADPLRFCAIQDPKAERHSCAAANPDRLS